MDMFRLNGQKTDQIFICVMIVWILLHCACNSNTREEATGRVAFKADFTSPKAANDRSELAGEIDVCTEYGIKTIIAKVIDANGMTSVEGAWPCDAEGHQGTLYEVPTGTGYRVVVEGIIAEFASWRGEIADITVTAGQTTNAGIVLMNATGEFPIIASASAGGSIEPAGTIRVAGDGTQTFSISPNPDFLVLDVVVDGTSVGAVETYTFEGVSAWHTIQATFASITHTVTASAGAGGSIDPSGDAAVIHGDSPSFTITADPGFYLSALLINGSSVAPQNPLVLNNVTVDTSVYAEFAAVVFADVDAPDGGDGLTWASAFNNLQTAVDNAPEGGDIWIKGGTYSLSDQVLVNKVVKIYGGFAGDELLLADRDASAHPTRVDGGLVTRCLYVEANAVINGLRIQNGRHTTETNGQGGGIYINQASPQLNDCTFYNNAAAVSNGGASGGAIYINGGSPAIIDCRFEYNYTADSPQPSQGGAIFNNNGYPTISDTTFVGNRAPGNQCSGGAISNNGGNSAISRCRFTNNYAGMTSDGMGGAIFNKGGMHTIDASTFRSNLAEGTINGQGGAIYNDVSVLTVTNTIFLENEARQSESGRGGAMYNYDSDPFITNCTFSANRAVGTVEPYALGAAILNMDSRPIIVNSIFWGNLADQWAAVFELGSSLTLLTYSNIDHGDKNGTGNISEDPQLDTRGHLRPGSPCINAGDDASAPATDVDGEARPQGSQSDMGADEMVDGDGDGMPDYWEVLYGLDVGKDDSGGDLDEDQAPNDFEYRFDLDPSTGNPVIEASQRGHYKDSGDHDQDDNSTPTGRLAGPMHRSYFIFALSGISDTVVSAVLRLEVANYQSAQSSDNLELYEVATSSTTLEASGTGETAIFEDLGTGTPYALLPVGSDLIGKILDIPLPQSALSDINNRRGGDFSVGLAVNFFGTVATEFITFSTGPEYRVHQLVLELQSNTEME